MNDNAPIAHDAHGHPRRGLPPEYRFQVWRNLEEGRETGVEAMPVFNWLDPVLAAGGTVCGPVFTQDDALGVPLPWDEVDLAERFCHWLRDRGWSEPADGLSYPTTARLQETGADSLRLAYLSDVSRLAQAVGSAREYAAGVKETHPDFNYYVDPDVMWERFLVEGTPGLTAYMGEQYQDAMRDFNGEVRERAVLVPLNDREIHALRMFSPPVTEAAVEEDGAVTIRF